MTAHRGKIDRTITYTYCSQRKNIELIHIYMTAHRGKIDRTYTHIHDCSQRKNR